MDRLAAAEHGRRQARRRYERALRAALPGGPEHTAIDLRGDRRPTHPERGT